MSENRPLQFTETIPRKGEYYLPDDLFATKKPTQSMFLPIFQTDDRKGSPFRRNDDNFYSAPTPLFRSPIESFPSGSESHKPPTKKLILSTKLARSKKGGGGVCSTSKPVTPSGCSPKVEVFRPKTGSDRKPLIQIDNNTHSHENQYAVVNLTFQPAFDQKSLESEFKPSLGAKGPEEELTNSRLSDLFKQEHFMIDPRKPSVIRDIENTLTQDSLMEMLLINEKGGILDKSPLKNPLSSCSSPKILEQLDFTPKSQTNIRMTFTELAGSPTFHVADPTHARPFNGAKPEFLKQKQKPKEIPHLELSKISESCNVLGTDATSGKESQARSNPSTRLIERPPTLMTWNEFIANLQGQLKGSITVRYETENPFRAPQQQPTNNQVQDNQPQTVEPTSQDLAMAFKKKQNPEISTMLSGDTKPQPTTQDTSTDKLLIVVPLDDLKTQPQDHLDNNTNKELALPAASQQGVGEKSEINQNIANLSHRSASYAIFEYSMDRNAKDRTFTMPEMVALRGSILQRLSVRDQNQPEPDNQPPKDAYVLTTILSEVQEEEKIVPSKSFVNTPKSQEKTPQIQKIEISKETPEPESLTLSLIDEDNADPIKECDKGFENGLTSPELTDINDKLRCAENKIVSTVEQIYCAAEGKPRDENYDNLLEEVSECLAITHKILNVDQDPTRIQNEVSKLEAIHQSIEEGSYASEAKTATLDKEHNDEESLKGSFREYLDQVICLAKEKQQHIEQIQAVTLSNIEADTHDQQHPGGEAGKPVHFNSRSFFAFSFAENIPEEEEKIPIKSSRTDKSQNKTYGESRYYSIEESKLQHSQLHQKNQSLLTQYKSLISGDTKFMSFVQTERSVESPLNVSDSGEVTDRKPNTFDTKTLESINNSRSLTECAENNSMKKLVGSKAKFSEETKEQFYEFAVEEKLKLEKNHPARSAVISQLLEEACQNNIPKEQWRAFIKMKFDNFTAKKK